MHPLLGRQQLLLKIVTIFIIEMNVIVLCYGNEFLKEDSLAKEVADEISIPGVDFIKSDSLNDILSYKAEDIFILDVIKNSDKVILIEDPDQLKAHKMVSLHDFDLAFFLKLMKGLGNLNRVKIIGIPPRGNKQKISTRIRSLLPVNL
jgi:Ni,Fe-hydrogenase maturation factor